MSKEGKVFQLDFTGDFLSFDGTPMTYLNEEGEETKFKDVNLWLAETLGNLKTDDPLRTMNLAKKIFEKKVISLENPDYIYLKKRIKEIKVSDILMSQILERIEK